jgi:predicted regulator of Ras-like GTPase activity (Roadblock/LC7/MglB family)
VEKKLMQKVDTTKTATEQNQGAAVISVGDDNAGFANLSASLAEIRKLKGVMGYILRSNTSAIIDLTENDKVIQYAILSSQIQESSSEMAKQFHLTEVESVLVEGKKVKVLCMSMGENRMSIFMEKTATHAWIIKRILL